MATTIRSGQFKPLRSPTLLAERMANPIDRQKIDSDREFLKSYRRRDHPGRYLIGFIRQAHLRSRVHVPSIAIYQKQQVTKRLLTISMTIDMIAPRGLKDDPRTDVHTTQKQDWSPSQEYDKSTRGIWYGPCYANTTELVNTAVNVP